MQWRIAKTRCGKSRRYVMGDNDSIFFVDNWVDVLAKYDHTKDLVELGLH